MLPAFSDISISYSNDDLLLKVIGAPESIFLLLTRTYWTVPAPYRYIFDSADKDMI